MYLYTHTQMEESREPRGKILSALSPLERSVSKQNLNPQHLILTVAIDTVKYI